MRKRSPDLKLVRRIPSDNRGILSKKLALKAADEVFKGLFFTLDSQIPTPAVLRAQYFLRNAYLSYCVVLNETFDRTLSPGESTLETAEGII